MARVFLDANVLAYLFDARVPRKQARAEEMLAQVGSLGVTNSGPKIWLQVPRSVACRW